MRAKRLLALAAFVALALGLAPESALAQCAMCRTALEQNGGELAGGFNRGILFLLGMPYLVFAAIGGAWHWKRKRLEAGSGDEPAERDAPWRSDLSEVPR